MSREGHRMKDGPVIAGVAALIGDPARANMLTALMDGRALTVSELAQSSGVGLPTASGHLAKLADAGLLGAERQGRHRYYRISGPDVAEVLEGLMSLAQRTGARRVRTGPREAALREARICYDHLAGERAVALVAALQRRGFIEGDEAWRVSSSGREFFHSLGVDTDRLARGRRLVCRACLDWSERRAHLGGALGAALLERFLAERWAERTGGRGVRITPEGDTILRKTAG